MSDSLRIFIRESLISEIDQKTWMKGSATTTVTPEKGDDDSLFSKAKEVIKKVFGLTGLTNVFSVRGKKINAWSTKGKVVGGVALGATALTWFLSGKDPNKSTEADKDAVEKAESELMELRDDLRILFARENDDLVRGVALSSPDPTDQTVTVDDKLAALRSHFETLIGKAGTIQIRSNYTPESARTEFESVLSNTPFKNIGPQIKDAVGDEPPKMSHASRLMMAYYANLILKQIQNYTDPIYAQTSTPAENDKIDRAISEITDRVERVPGFVETNRYFEAS